MPDGEFDVLSACVPERELFDGVFAVCNTASIGAELDSSVSGTVSFEGGTLTRQVTISAEAMVVLPNNCTGCQCTTMESMLASSGVIASCSPVCSGGNCNCTVSVGMTIDDSATYAADGSTLTTSDGTFTVCENELGATLAEQDGATLGLAAPGSGAPETCNGVDDDDDGIVDENVVECPPCVDVGVCADGVNATCSAGTWQCEYTSSHWEQEETSCDGLDNDCDGEWDEVVS